MGMRPATAALPCGHLFPARRPPPAKPPAAIKPREPRRSRWPQGPEGILALRGNPRSPPPPAHFTGFFLSAEPPRAVRCCYCTSPIKFPFFAFLLTPESSILYLRIPHSPPPASSRMKPRAFFRLVLLSHLCPVPLPFLPAKAAPVITVITASKCFGVLWDEDERGVPTGLRFTIRIRDR